LTTAGPCDTLAGAGIKDNPDKSRFELVIDGALAVVEYRRMGKTLIAYLVSSRYKGFDKK
jgi:hypothetical protein